ncbi:MAG TPA: hypothetical protein PKJ85_10875 [Nitrosomonas nitrosa]|uniref:hypothetical protein n=1 Tax=Nitrosomonas nitrosa TaxID=52442 RepID=UPI000D310311|nr:hypothetical protein [Nitrosomonas nitrosa]MCO6433718.1 hypothetical protein [Nitrosomonas nitrosa]HNP52282.1 hypothetical protein [Nitrosomonas nitrosa]
MFLDNKEEFQTVWQLAHNWTGANQDETDTVEISHELKITIHRLLHAMVCQEISARTRKRRILEDNSNITFILDIYHNYKFFQCLRKNEFDKAYLDNLYVKRNEVIKWCAHVIYLDPPPCWAPKKPLSAERSLAETMEIEDEDKGWYEKLTDLRRKKVASLELAKMLWEKDENQSYEQIRNHPIMKQYGNPSVFTPDAFQSWAKEYASDYARKGGRRKKSKE